MAAPDPGWMPFVKISFGFCILLVLAGLAAIISLGRVHAESSFGLDIILGGLLTLSGGFAGWAFQGTSKQPNEPEMAKDLEASTRDRA
jgi:hypothetical protein